MFSNTDKSVYILIVVFRREQTEEPTVSSELGLDFSGETELCGGWAGQSSRGDPQA